MLGRVCRAAGVERFQKPPFPLIKSGSYMHFFSPLSSSLQIPCSAKLEEAKVKSDAAAERENGRLRPTAGILGFLLA